MVFTFLVSLAPCTLSRGTRPLAQASEWGEGALPQTTQAREGMAGKRAQGTYKNP